MAEEKELPVEPLAVKPFNLDKLIQLEREAAEERATSRMRVKHLDFVTALIDAAPMLLKELAQVRQVSDERGNYIRRQDKRISELRRMLAERS